MVTAKWQRGGQRRSLKVEVRSEIWHIIATWLHAPRLQYLWRLRAFKETTSGHSCWPVGIHVFASPCTTLGPCPNTNVSGRIPVWWMTCATPWTMDGCGDMNMRMSCFFANHHTYLIRLLATVLPYNVNIATALSSPLLPPQDWAGGWVSKRSWLRVNNKIPQFWINIKTHQVFVLQGSNLQ
jgi:hypothetical protein